MYGIEPLAKELREELRKLCRGDVFFYGDPRCERTVRVRCRESSDLHIEVLFTIPTFLTVTWFRWPKQLFVPWMQRTSAGLHYFTNHAAISVLND